jgi:hypothetical protein
VGTIDCWECKTNLESYQTVCEGVWSSVVRSYRDDDPSPIGLEHEPCCHIVYLLEALIFGRVRLSLDLTRRSAGVCTLRKQWAVGYIDIIF